MHSQSNLFRLFQITDSFFPIGSFAYSRGLETYVNEETVRDRKGLEKFLKAYLTGLTAKSDVLFLILSWEAAEREELSTILRLDKLSHSMRLARELREGSLQAGGQLLKVMRALHSSKLLEHFAGEVETGKAWGHHPVVFALVCGALEISKEDSVIAYLYQTVSSIVSAGVRLIPLGHLDGQRAIEEVRPLALKIAEDLVSLSEDDLSSFAPGIEIRAMKHECLYTRLFRS
ncbi:MAG TPA: urease accessory protein UreF [Thermodesulfobacteriota bacterium]|nr:urease accessory protein UreF [Thermodesulfobacteriota bacterium]